MNYKKINLYKSHLIAPFDQCIAVNMTLLNLLHDLNTFISCYLHGSLVKLNHESSLNLISPLHESHDSQQAHQ